ncbi:MAG TPA: 4-hydroxy-tetrahydrodipicolinate synthase [Gammaproteobacteria bacterium]|nr:4-hydroxy-tetrahydrodipicolinate synthase [Gammaproteobacteria bacterium]
MLAGSMVALVTPMSDDGAVNEDELGRLIDFHIEAGTEALVIAGTTGESATLTHEEHLDLLERSCRLTAGRIPVIAGTGSNSTRQTLELSAKASRLKIEALLIVTPYYNKPTQEGLVRHYTAIADAVERPIILYNVPGRTAVDLKPATVVRLAGHPRIVGIKEATGEIGRVEELRDACGPDFTLLSGDDATACEFMLAGGDGVISVTGNVAPAQMRELCDAARAGKRDEAEAIDAYLRDLHRNLFIESNPIPVKWALNAMGLIGSGIRLPLTELAPEHRPAVSAALAKAGLGLAA